MLILSVAMLIVIVKSFLLSVITLSVFMLTTFSLTTLNADIKCSITIKM
jgi:hypothetical protein